MLTSCVKWASLAALLAFAGGAQAQSAATATGPEVSIDLPKPWPLRHLVAAGTLTIATTGKSAGLTFVDESGKLAGARIDLWAKLADDLGVKPDFVVIDWPGVLPGLAANRFDIACEGASWTKARLGSPDFYMTRPLEVAINVGVVLKSSGIASWSDAAGKRLGGVKGEQELKDLLAKAGAKTASLELPGVPEARLALLNGQYDVYGTGMQVAQTLLKGEDGDKFTILGEPTAVDASGFCVNKNEGDLAQAVNVLLAKYSVDGTMARINKKWDMPDTTANLAKLGY